ncbi:MAG: hypothetical protein Q8M29_07310 [Bacteroidota bacterium]|nr:hypothetical protein [Bacteroidota bacterium]
MKTIIQIVIMLTLVILTNGCSKQGPIGPKGDEGKVGNNGNANVSSATFTMSSWFWSAPYYYADLSIPELTTTNANTAAVMVYFNTTGGTTWVALPYTQYHSPYNYYMGFNTGVGNVEVTWFYDSSLSSGSDPNAFYGTTIKCKVVVIPPAIKKKHPDLDLTNYEAVKKCFNLAD